MSITTHLNTLKNRCDGITSIKTVVKRKRDFNPDELPAVAIYRGQTSVDEQLSGSKIRLTVPLVVEYHKEAATDDPATEAEAMVDAVLAAVEVGSWGDCETVFDQAGDDVTLPPDDGNVIIVQVLFTVEVIRQFGGAAA